MRSERYKTIQHMIATNTFIVTERNRCGSTEYITASIINPMFFQLTPEEVLDGIQGYLGSNDHLVTRYECTTRGEWTELEITVERTDNASPRY